MSETGNVTPQHPWNITDLDGKAFSAENLPARGQQVRSRLDLSNFGVVLRFEYELVCVLWSAPRDKDTFWGDGKLWAIQPMTMPRGDIFYLDYQYPTGSVKNP